MNILVPKVPITCLRNISSDDTPRLPSPPPSQEVISSKLEVPIKVNKRKGGLLDKILKALKKNPKGLSRKELVKSAKFTEIEKKRLSLYLTRAIKKGLIKTRKKKNGSIYSCQKEL